MKSSHTIALAVALMAAAAPAAAQHSHGHGGAHSTRAANDTSAHAHTAADVHFMTAMIAHHSQAVVMANWAPTHGAGERVRTLAARIVNAQQDEIATMRQWLRDRGQPVPEAGATSMTMHDGSTHSMPGMLSAEQLAQLDAARGAEFDRLFLQYMIQHHNGAVSMVSELFGTDGAAQDEAVFKFASDVNVDQITEIGRMQRMLATLLFGGSSQ
ncbi:MAG TPA: DUF305 domain-containing protein [Longimicrobium sp.]|jgi:uncharacterized protein (DUF305 family)